MDYSALARSYDINLRQIHSSNVYKYHCDFWKRGCIQF